MAAALGGRSGGGGSSGAGGGFGGGTGNSRSGLLDKGFSVVIDREEVLTALNLAKKMPHQPSETALEDGGSKCEN